MIAENLGESGICICPNFISPQLLIELRKDLQSLVEAGRFKRAGIGQGESLQVLDLVRRDEILWWTRETASTIQLNLWIQIDNLMSVINRSLYLGLKTF